VVEQQRAPKKGDEMKESVGGKCRSQSMEQVKILMEASSGRISAVWSLEVFGGRKEENRWVR
jgi:hypothetical protein